MKSSNAVRRCLVSTLLITGCSGTPDKIRNRYATQDDCLRDYSAMHCKRGSGSGGAFFLGPYFMASQVGSFASGRTSFGSSGISASASHLDNSHGVSMPRDQAVSSASSPQGMKSFSSSGSSSISKGGFGSTASGRSSSSS